MSEKWVLEFTPRALENFINQAVERCMDKFVGGNQLDPIVTYHPMNQKKLRELIVTQLLSYNPVDQYFKE